MAELTRLKTKIGITHTLLGLVRNVKALAAVTIREQQMVSQGLHRYEEALLDGLALLARQTRPGPPESSRSHARIVMGSDQGLCGTFNQRLAEQIQPVTGPLLVVGYRMGRELERRGHTADEVLVTPNGPGGVHSVVGRLVFQLESWQRQGHHTVSLHANSPAGPGLEYQQSARKVLPLDQDWWAELSLRPWKKGSSLPLCLSPPEASLRHLLRQWLYVTIYRTLSQSRLAENEARLATMQSAESNISERLLELERDFRQQRQTMIDAELLDISAGFESLVKN